ncbi:MAG TPA: hypothetical protein VN915_09450 [Elusimicrobiota bacterium]|nr:hypothetical protein [Elusimicrobiota bacterium]
MKYRRLNITLPAPVAKELEKAKISNKSAFIARAVTERLGTLRKIARRRALLEDYRWVAKHPEYEKDGRDDW